MTSGARTASGHSPGQRRRHGMQPRCDRADQTPRTRRVRILSTQSSRVVVVQSGVGLVGGVPGGSGRGEPGHLLLRHRYALPAPLAACIAWRGGHDHVAEAINHPTLRAVAEGLRRRAPDRLTPEPLAHTTESRASSGMRDAGRLLRRDLLRVGTCMGAGAVVVTPSVPKAVVRCWTMSVGEMAGLAW